MKQTTMVVKIVGSYFLNEGSSEIWEALSMLRRQGFEVSVEKTIHGSIPKRIKEAL